MLNLSLTTNHGYAVPFEMLWGIRGAHMGLRDAAGIWGRCLPSQNVAGGQEDTPDHQNQR